MLCCHIISAKLCNRKCNTAAGGGGYRLAVNIAIDVFAPDSGRHGIGAGVQIVAPMGAAATGA